MPDMRIADFLRHDVQAYGVPGAPDIDRILQACIEAANWIDKLESHLAQAERERDAAVTDLRIYAGCKVCKFGDLKFPNDCMDCIRMCNWEWRGVCKENTKEEGK